MASNFQICINKTKNSLHLKLAGDFDGNSAYELINHLLEHGAGLYQIFIDTNDIKTIHPFGKAVFEKKICGFKKKLGHLQFIGNNGHNFIVD